MSHNTLSTSILLISQLPKQLQLKFYMFFNCPVSVDYQAVLNFILRLNIGQDIAQRVQDVQIENQHFVTQNIIF